MADPVLAIEDLSISFRSAGVLAPALRDFSLELRAREVVGLVGESGSGKSTVLFAAMRALAENAVVERGRILFHGSDLLAASRADLDRIRGSRIAMVFQDPGSALNPSMRAGRQVAETLTRHLGLGERAARARTLELFRLVRLDDPEVAWRAWPHELSGGMRQRVMIAMAVACEPEILLMDEPTTALDVLVQAHILDLVASLRRELSAAILFVSHDLGAVARIADRIGVLYAGETMELGARDDILLRSRNPYTRGLLAAVPRVNDPTPPRAIPGFASKDPSRFARCVFSDRCAFAEPVCAEARPSFVAVPGRPQASRCHFALDPRILAARKPGHAALPGAGTHDTLLEVEDLVVTYGARRAIDGVSLRVDRDDVLAVVGESGSGKSTLARALLRLEPAAAGRIRFAGEDVLSLRGEALKRYRRQVQIVFQNPTSSLNPRHTVGELVGRPLRLAGVGAAEAGERVRAALAAVGLPDSFAARLPVRLSGGEKQRVAIARAIVTEPALVILDEPTTALDVSVQAAILDLLVELKQRIHCAYLLISHDLAVVRRLADRVLVLRTGKACESGQAAEIFAAPRHPYTRALIAAVPEPPVAAEPGC